MNRSSPPPRFIVPCFAMLLPVTAPAVPEIVAGPWCGAVTPSSVAVTAHLGQPGIQARLAASTLPDFSGALFSPPVTSAATTGNNVRLDLAGLTPDTPYFYAVELDGILQVAPTKTGTFRTLPPPGPASFRFGFSSCGDWEEPGQFVHRTILTEQLRFFFHMGDLNYRDTNENDPLPYRSNYINTLNESPELGDLFRQLPTSYIWDDHDFSGNTSDRTSNGRSAHRQVYREMVPHYPLPAGGPDAAIQQTFQCGRVRFILSDLRSERDPDSWDDDSNKSMMGAPQKQWFKDQLVAARDSETPLIVWMCGLPFLSNSSLRDNWGSYQTERTELLEFIRDEDIRNIVIISGDMHALAYDDGGTTEDYVPGVRIPVFHGAALTRNGSEKGGPYSGGVTQGSGRYGIIEVTDNGSDVAATYTGRIATSATAATTWKTYTHVAAPIRPRTASGVAAVAVLDHIRVTWSDESGIESGFRIERRDAGAAGWTPLATVAAGVTGFDDVAVTGTASYDYRMITLNGAENSTPSPLATATASDRYRTWKLLRLGDAEAPDDGDGDGDGRGNVDEYYFDTDPVAADSYDWQVSPVSPGGEVTVTVPTRPGRVYRVEFSNDLATWGHGSALIPGDGESHPWIDDGSSTGGVPSPSGRRFYRIAVTESP